MVTFDEVEEAQVPRVLLVDDDAHVARALVRVLKRYCDVEVAHSVAEAESLLEESESFDLILCDLRLPVRGGADFYRSLRKRDLSQARRVAFMTGMGDDAMAGDELEEVPCFGKPIDLAMVRDLILTSGSNR